MAQQVFAQWHPVAKALDEENNEIYIPFAGIHAQTRDGKDEVIIGAGAMVWDPNAGMWVPVDAANPMEVRVRQLEAQIAALQQFLEGRLNADLADVLARLNTDLSTRASEQTLVQARDALSALAGTVDAGAQKVTLTGQSVPDNQPIPVKTITQAHRSWNLRGMDEVTIAPGMSVSDTPLIPVNGYGRIIVLVRDVSQEGNKRIEIRLRWQTESGAAKPLRSSIETVYNDTTDQFGTTIVETTTKSQYVSIIMFNRDSVERTFHVHGMMTIS